MKNMTLANIAACLESPLMQGAGKEETEITGAVLDSRKVEPGYLFFCNKRRTGGWSQLYTAGCRKGSGLGCM